MKSAPPWMLALHVFVLFNIASHLAEVAADGRNSGFISIDCGASRDHVDEVTGNWYQTDESFIESGTNQRIGHNYPATTQLEMTLRSFPDGERNCYTLKPKQEKQKQKYLIRAIFAYGNYDLKNQHPVFDLHLGVNYWATVGISFYFEPPVQYFEMIMELHSSTEIVQVCLVNTGQGI